MQHRPQPGLFTEETAQHLHVEWTLPARAAADEVVGAVAAARRATAYLRSPNTVWGFDPVLWRRLAPADCPANVEPFRGVGTAPATQRSVWLWVHGNDWAKVWRSGRDAHAALAAVADDMQEIRAFLGRDNRDPTGFIDGTENPQLDEAYEVALYRDGEPGAGGTTALVQLWQHDLRAFEALSVAEQEAVFGRTRQTSEELPEDLMPATSHVSRNVITDAAGAERHIYRRNTPWATVAEAGTVFIGCANQPDRIDEMLARMFGTSGDGLRDALTGFSRPLTGSYYFVPSFDALTAVFGALEEPDPVPPADLSLGIGDLRTR